VVGVDGRALGEVGEGNRKDLRNAVEAAHKAAGWARQTGHARAQVLYYVAENLAARAGEFAARLDAMTGTGDGAAEVDVAVARLFTYAAWGDKYDGAVHNVPIRGVALAMHEAIGVSGVAAPESRPLLGLISMVAPLVAMGNTVVAVPSERHPLAATDFYTVLDTSDVPGGVVNIVTGREGRARARARRARRRRRGLVRRHARGCAGGGAGVGRQHEADVGRVGAARLGRPARGEGREFLRRATQVKNVWVPYGE
jgi:aldehyde dehydrogenase (NAD+)